MKGKRCLIVGGTSGIGLAAASRFLDEGATVVVAGLDREQGESALVELRLRGPAAFVACDARLSGEVEELYARAIDWMKGLDVLYHVAGQSGRRHGDGPLHECTEEGWHATLDANLTSTYRTNRAAVRHFLTQGRGGVILNMASVLALSPSPRHFDTTAYAAAKAGVIGLSRYAAARYAADGIRVNVLAPGLIATPMASRAIQDPAIGAYLARKQPLGPGAGRPEDCAGAAVFLCGDEARFLTGVVLTVDGGWCVSEPDCPPADPPPGLTPRTDS